MVTKTYRAKGSLRSNNFAVPANQTEAADFVKEIGDNRREITRIEAEMNDEIAKIKQEYEAVAKPVADETDDLINGLQSYAETHREDLTDGGKTKTVKMQTGEISWRNRPPKVSLRGKDKILCTLKDLGLQRFIRTQEDVDKEALLKEKSAVGGISGITISSAGEDFSVSPYELEIDNQN